MNIDVSPNSPVPIYQQIVDQIKARILTGELKSGDPLPSIRQLAGELLASVITTRRAYSELETEGLIMTRAGLGTFVADLEPGAIEALKDEVVTAYLVKAVRAGRQLGLSNKHILSLCQQVLSETKE